MAVSGVTHDITIADHGGTNNKRGFMFWRKKLRRGYVIRDAQTIAPRVLTQGEYGEAEQSPQYRLYWSQEDWEAGVGGEVHRVTPHKLRLARKIDTSVPFTLQNAPERYATTVNSNPTEYVSAGLQRSGAQLWCTIGRHTYRMTDYTTNQWVQQTLPVDAARLYRNGVEFETNIYAPAWADDAGSGGLYTGDDLPTSYIYKAFSDSQWTVSTLNPRYCKYMAVAHDKLWCGYIADVATTTVTVQASQFDSAVSGTNAANTTISINLTVGNNSNRMAIIGVAVNDAVETTPSAVTVAGQAATQIGSTYTTGTYSLSFWRRLAPIVAVDAVAVTFATNYDEVIVGALSLYNVQQTTPAGAVATATGTSTAPSVAVASAIGDLVVAMVMSQTNVTHAAGTGETERVDQTGGVAIRASIGTEIATSTSTTMAPTLGGADTWYTAGVAVKPIEIDSSQTTITTTTTPSAQFVAGDVIRVDTELMLITAVTDATPSITVVRGYRGTAAAAHSNPITISEVTVNVHHVRSATDATNSGAWTSATTIGDASAPITAIVGVNTDLFVFKTDGIYILEADGEVTNIRAELGANQHPDNFRGAFAWNDKIYAPLGAGGMLEIDTVTFAIRDVSMEVYAPKDTVLHGRVAALAGDATRLYALILDSANTQYHVLKAEYIVVDGVNDLRWDHYAVIAYTTATDEDHAMLMAEAIPNGANIHQRLWAGIESTGSNLFPYFLPTHTSDRDWGFTNDNDGYAQTVEFDGGLPRVDKSFVSVDVTSLNLGAGGRQFNLSYRLDRTGSWLTTLTDAAGNADGIADATSGQEVLTFPSGTTGKVLEIQFAPKLTTVGTTSPKLVKFRVTMQLRPDSLKLLPHRLYIADRQELLNGSMGGTPKADLTQLRTWAAQAAEVRHTDASGTARQCVFLPGTYSEEELVKERGRRAEFVVDFELAVAD